MAHALTCSCRVSWLRARRRRAAAAGVVNSAPSSVSLSLVFSQSSPLFSFFASGESNVNSLWLSLLPSVHGLPRLTRQSAAQVRPRASGAYRHAGSADHCLQCGVSYRALHLGNLHQRCDQGWRGVLHDLEVAWARVWRRHRHCLLFCQRFRFWALQ